MIAVLPHAIKFESHKNKGFCTQDLNLLSCYHCELQNDVMLPDRMCNPLQLYFYFVFNIFNTKINTNLHLLPNLHLLTNLILKN